MVKKQTVSRKTTKRAVKKTAKTTAVRNVSVAVGRFGEEPTSLVVRSNSTVGAVLKKAGVEPTSSERIWKNGGEAKLTDKVRNGDIVSIVAPKQAGI